MKNIIIPIMFLIATSLHAQTVIVEPGSFSEPMVIMEGDSIAISIFSDEEVITAFWYKISDSKDWTKEIPKWKSNHYKLKIPATESFIEYVVIYGKTHYKCATQCGEIRLPQKETTEYGYRPDHRRLPMW